MFAAGRTRRVVLGVVGMASWLVTLGRFGGGIVGKTDMCRMVSLDLNGGLLYFCCMGNLMKISFIEGEMVVLGGRGKCPLNNAGSLKERFCVL